MKQSLTTKIAKVTKGFGYFLMVNFVLFASFVVRFVVSWVAVNRVKIQLTNSH